MKIATWNVNSINVRMPQLLEWLETADVDVACFQETKTIDDGFPAEALKAAGYNACLWAKRRITASRSSRIPDRGCAKEFCRRRRGAPNECRGDRQGVRIVNTYSKWLELWSDKFRFKLDWLQRLRRFFDDTCDANSDVLLCGDFNVAPDELDVWNAPAYEGKLHFSKPERAAIPFVKQWGFTDLFRQMNGDVREFSWWDYRAGAWQNNRGLRIDHMWASASLAAKCTGCWIDKAPRALTLPSDHAPVIAEFK
jgi:exodeoxyribonuclease-3